jgi:GxxExxY protein
MTILEPRRPSFGWRGGTVGLVEHPINQLSDRVIGAAIEVHRHLGPGLLESSYHTCLRHEFDLRGIVYISQLILPIEYKGIQLSRGYVVDFLVEDSLVVELKAVDKLLAIHHAQIMTYMRLLEKAAGLLMNFNAPILPKGIRRILR